MGIGSQGLGSKERLTGVSWTHSRGVKPGVKG
jgi:hypothetical protein